MKPSAYLFLLIFFFSHCRPKEEPVMTVFSGKPAVPSSLKNEHKRLLGIIQKMTLLQDSTGRTAAKLNELMLHHFKEEEDYVLPALGLLPALAGGKLPEESKEIILLTQKLKSQLNHLSAEHQMIKAILDELLLAADYNKHPEAAAFARDVGKHAAEEEEVFFPAAILTGDYLMLQAGMEHHPDSIR